MSHYSSLIAIFVRTRVSDSAYSDFAVDKPLSFIEVAFQVVTWYVTFQCLFNCLSSGDYGMPNILLPYMIFVEQLQIRISVVDLGNIDKII